MPSNNRVVDFPIDEVFAAYYEARRHKRGTTSQLAFELNLEENLVTLWRELNDRTYAVGTSICFVIEDTVAREVFAADFRDRVVHHLLYNRLSPFFGRRFICDSYSCRQGKGALYGIKRLEHHIRSCSRNYSQPCHVLKLDIRGYFMHISRSRLLDIIESSLPDDFPKRDSLIWLCRLTVECEPVVNCRVKGSLSTWKKLPYDKSHHCALVPGSNNQIHLPIAEPFPIGLQWALIDADTILYRHLTSDRPVPMLQPVTAIFV